MVKLLAMLALLLMSTGLAWGQAIQPGDYTMDWSVLHRPFSSDQPTLEAGASSVRLQSSAGSGVCPRHRPSSS